MLLNMDILSRQEDKGEKKKEKEKAYHGEDEEVAPLKMRKFSVSNVK